MCVASMYLQSLQSKGTESTLFQGTMWTEYTFGFRFIIYFKTVESLALFNEIDV